MEMIAVLFSSLVQSVITSSLEVEFYQQVVTKQRSKRSETPFKPNQDDLDRKLRKPKAHRMREKQIK